MNHFEKILSVSTQDIELELRGITFIEWSGFYLNPRWLRGSDFLMRWSQGVWSEKSKQTYQAPSGPTTIKYIYIKFIIIMHTRLVNRLKYQN